MPSGVVPYMTMLALGALGRDLEQLSEAVTFIKQDLDSVVHELAGSLASRQASDDFWNQFGIDVDTYIEANEDDDA